MAAMSQQTESLAAAIEKCREKLEQCCSSETLIRENWAHHRLVGFNLWAASVGGQRSLQHRLRHSQETTDVLLMLLGCLEDELERCLRTGSAQSSTRLGSDGMNIVPSGPSSIPACREVESILYSLVDLGILIRQAAQHSRLRKADAHFSKVDLGLKQHLELVLQSYPRPDGPAPGHEFGVESTVSTITNTALRPEQRHIVQVNLRRRHRFHWARHRFDHIQASPSTTSTGTPLHRPSRSNHDARGESHAALGVPSPMHAHIQSAPPGTSASTVDPKVLNKQLPLRGNRAPNAPSIGLSVTTAKLDYPKAPVLPGRHEFLCPCCYLTLPVMNEHKWKSHVSQDILPYTCPNADCDSLDQMFASKLLLSEHLNKQHMTVSLYTCQFCTTAHFETFSEIETHTRDNHSEDIPADSIDMLIRLSAHEVWQLPQMCPVCSRGRESLQSEQYFDHVCECLHDFSLRSLPWNDRARAEYRSHGVSRLNDADTTFHNMPQVTTWLMGADSVAVAEPDHNLAPLDLPEDAKLIPGEPGYIRPVTPFDRHPALDAPPRIVTVFIPQPGGIENISALESVHEPEQQRFGDENYFAEEDEFDREVTLPQLLLWLDAPNDHLSESEDTKIAKLITSQLSGSEVARKWLSESTPCWWVHGSLAADHTTLNSAMAQYIKSCEPDSWVLRYCFSKSEPPKQHLHAMLLSLASQLCRYDCDARLINGKVDDGYLPVVYKAAQTAYHHGSLETEAIEGILTGLFKASQETCILIYDIEACQEQNQVVDWCCDFADCCETVHVMFASAHGPPEEINTEGMSILALAPLGSHVPSPTSKEVVSGPELILGAMPLLIGSLEQYKKCFEDLGCWRRYRAEYMKCKNRIQDFSLYYNLTLSLIFASIIEDEDELEALKADPKEYRAQWQVLESNLKYRLMPQAYDIYLTTTKYIIVEVEKLKVSLGGDHSPALQETEWHRMQERSIYEARRLRFSQGRYERERLFSEIERLVMSLKELVRKNDKLGFHRKAQQLPQSAIDAIEAHRKQHEDRYGQQTEHQGPDRSSSGDSSNPPDSGPRGDAQSSIPGTRRLPADYSSPAEHDRSSSMDDSYPNDQIGLGMPQNLASGWGPVGDGSKQPFEIPAVGPPASNVQSQPVLPAANTSVKYLCSITEAFEWHRNRKYGSWNEKLPHYELMSDLKDRDHIFFVDDSSSMKIHWSSLTNVLRLLAYITKEMDPDGLELYLLSTGKRFTSKNSTKLYDMVRSHNPVAINNLNGIFEKEIRKYGEEIDRWRSSSLPFRRAPPRQRSVYVLTDGVWGTGGDSQGQECIRNLVRRLHAAQLPRQQIGIQFISFGNDHEGLARLDRLDQLAQLDPADKLPLDIVDTEPSDGNLWKMLLGAINTKFDHDKPD